MPLWAWILFYILVFIMLIIDLKSFGKKGQHEVSVTEALKMTAVWIGVSLIFCAGIYFFYPVEHPRQTVRWALLVDLLTERRRERQVETGKGK